jgi:hypothetical protein
VVMRLWPLGRGISAHLTLCALGWQCTDLGDDVGGQAVVDLGNQIL